MYQMKQVLNVGPTMGLDGAEGAARILGVMDFESVPEWASEPFTQGLDLEEYADLTNATWYSFRYVEDAVHENWGVMYLPEDLLESMVRVAA